MLLTTPEGSYGKAIRALVNFHGESDETESQTVPHIMLMLEKLDSSCTNKVRAAWYLRLQLTPRDHLLHLRRYRRQ